MKGPWSEKIGTNQISAVREKGQNETSLVRDKWKKIKGLQSEKNGKKSKVCDQRKMAKYQKFAVKE